jgi:hypothetical protein
MIMKYYLVTLLLLTSCVGVNKEVLEFGLNSKMILKDGQKQITPTESLLQKFRLNCQSEYLNNYLNKIFLIQYEYTTFISLVTSKETSDLDSLILKDSSFNFNGFKISDIPNEINGSERFYIFKVEKRTLIKSPFIRIAFKEPGLTNVVIMDIFFENSKSEDNFFKTGVISFISEIKNIHIPKNNL